MENSSSLAADYKVVRIIVMSGGHEEQTESKTNDHHTVESRKRRSSPAAAFDISQQIQCPTVSQMNGSRPSRIPEPKKSKKTPSYLKDAEYWERRRKNNEAAKRCRDSRKAKEDYILKRMAVLEEENRRLRTLLHSITTASHQLHHCYNNLSSLASANNCAPPPRLF